MTLCFEHPLATVCASAVRFVSRLPTLRDSRPPPSYTTHFHLLPDTVCFASALCVFVSPIKLSIRIGFQRSYGIQSTYPSTLATALFRCAIHPAMADMSAGLLPKRRDSTATATHNTNANHSKINTHTTPGAHSQAAMSVTRDELNKHRGLLATMAVSAAGSSFLQACLRAFPGEALPLVRAELMPRFRELANNDHGVYCLRLVLESSRETFMNTLQGEDATDDAFWCGLCTNRFTPGVSFSSFLNNWGTARTSGCAER